MNNFHTYVINHNLLIQLTEKKVIDQKVVKVFLQCPPRPLSAGGKQIYQKLLLRGITIFVVNGGEATYWGNSSAKERQIIKGTTFISKTHIQ